MKSVVGALRVNLGLDSARFKKGLNDAQKGLSNTGRQMRKLGAGLSLAVTAPMVLAGRDALRLARTQEAAQATVVQAVKSTEGAAGLAADKLFEMAAGLQEASKFGDEDILGNVTAQLLTFTNIAGDEFGRAQQAILDVSTVMKTDLKSTAIQLGKALNDPVAGLSALSRTGIQFTEDQKKVIESLVEAGDVAGAQGIILDELSKQFGGQAAAAAGTLDGKIVSLNNAWGDLKEQFGALIAEFLPPIIDGLRKLISWVSDLDPKTKELSLKFGLIGAALGPLLIALGLAATAIAAIGAPIALAVAGIGALIAAVVAFWPEIEAATDAVVGFGKDVIAYLADLPGQIAAVFAELPAQMASIGADILAGLMQGLRDKYQGVKDSITGFAGGLISSVKDTLGIQSPSRVFKEIGVNIMQGLGDGLAETGAQVSETMRGITDDLGGQIDGLFKSVLFKGGSFKSGLASLFGNLSGKVFSNATAGLGDALLSKIPGFADGTMNAPRGLALVGERGPELVRFRGGEQVVPNGQFGGGTVINQNLTFNGGGGGMADVQQIRRVVRDEAMAVIARSNREGR